MLHTLEINYRLNKKEYNSLFDDIKDHCKKKHSKLYKEDDKNDWYTTNVSKEKGVIWFLKKNVIKSGSIFYLIEARINPKVLVDKDYINITDKDTLKAAIKEFNKLSEDISEDMPKFKDYNIKRIDYCINIDVGKLDIDVAAENVIELFKKSDKPSEFDELQYYDKKSKRKKSYEYCYYLMNDSVHINIYWKYDQLKNKMPDCENIEESKNIIRFEVQCMPSKLKELRKEFDIDKNEDEELLTDKICRKILKSYFKSTIGEGDYYSTSNAKKRIESSEFNEPLKKRMLYTLELIRKKRSIYKVRETLESKYERECFNNTINKISQLNINPVTIPDKWEIDYIPSFISAINE